MTGARIMAGDRPEAPYDAVVLAGGRARRMGGRDKPGMPLRGRPLIERVAAAVADAGRLIVVGPERPGLPDALFTRERPPGGGPVPALRAGLALVTAPRVALLAADLPFLTPAQVGPLRAAAESSRAGAVLLDDQDRLQWLTGVWRTDPLREALAAYRGHSLRGLLGPLDPVRLALPAPEDGRAAWFDCDTIEDLRRASELS